LRKLESSEECIDDALLELTEKAVNFEALLKVGFELDVDVERLMNEIEGERALECDVGGEIGLEKVEVERVE
jgi:hypothetical protein